MREVKMAQSREARNARRRKHHQENRDRILKEKRDHHHKNREELNAKRRKNHHLYAEKMAAYSKVYRRENADKINAQQGIRIGSKVDTFLRGAQVNRYRTLYTGIHHVYTVGSDTDG